MTIVIARQWGDRIILHSDTMISVRNATCDDIIPGQLKAIVLTPKLSVAYAGRVFKALPTIRKVQVAAREGAELPDILESLRKATGEETEPVDFLVISHYEDPTLYKIWKGQVSTGASWYWIGDPDVADAVQKAMELMPTAQTHEGFPEEESRLALAFAEVLQKSTFQGVGGFPFYLLGSPYGHCYQETAGSYLLGTFRSDELNTPEFYSLKTTGTIYFTYTQISSYRGAGVIGAFLPQIGLGFIYSPLQSDLVLRRPGITVREVSLEVARIAAELLYPNELIP